MIKTIITLALIMLGISLIIAVMANAKQDTCPQDEPWTKIDSGDLSTYPVDGAVEYCFKAGNWLDSVYPDGGFGQDGSCNNGIQYCDLSHWSYRLTTPTPTIPPTPTTPPTPTIGVTPTASPTTEPTNTPTPEVIPTIIPTVTPTPTPTPTHTPSPTSSPNPTATPKPEENKDEPVDESYKLVEQPEVYPAGIK